MFKKFLTYYDNPRTLRKFTAAVLTSDGNFAIGTPTLIIVDGDNIDVEFESAVCRREANIYAFVVVNELGECVARKNFGFICRSGTDTLRFNYYIQPEPEWTHH